MPPSGPISMMWSAHFITSKLCSITTTVLPPSLRRCRISTSLWTSAKCRPVVGSSSMYIVFPVLRLLSSVASLIRCASPPESSVDGCQSLIYDRPTSLSASIFLLIEGTFSKNLTASSTLISSTSYIVLPLYLTSRVSLL